MEPSLKTLNIFIMCFEIRRLPATAHLGYQMLWLATAGGIFEKDVVRLKITCVRNVI